LAARLLSMLLVLPLYPGLVRLAKSAVPEFWISYQRALKWLICLSAPVAIIFVFAPDTVVRTLLGAKFLASTTALQWFGLAFVPMFVSALFPYVYTALGRQRMFFVVTGIALALRLLLELWLIPKFGYMSACVIAAWCEILPFAAFVILLGRGQARQLWADTFIKPAVAGLVMGGVLIGGQVYLGVGEQLGFKLVLFCVAGAAYVSVLLITRSFTKGELSSAREALNFVGPYLRSLRQKPGTPS
jgi:O-antigen/teichoic acid export membrane protein